ncbi:ATP/GTP-binding protein [Jiangella rhizosphaerae]|uniref:ATP/GTP-binding protein n=2 Tax=Jiangella rhizosphaerae TaxID=2293569 RepID=A0A418KTN8_9ACTN|nr:ATP/GTP-binding protein [Jiangella rhizosphaerae]
MRFEPLELGLAPRPLEQAPGSIGLVGAPVWMWVTNAGPTTWGPIEESATAGGITVTVTAEVESVTWDMGDGTSVSCETPGDAYVPALGVRPSPSCGHTYAQTSADQPGTAYAVTATANWTATWTASTGVGGTLEPPRPATTAHVRIGERQVIEIG